MELDKELMDLKTWQLIAACTTEADKEVKRRWTSSNDIVKVRNSNNAKEYIKTLDMAELLGIKRHDKFNDILEKDDDYSASIYVYKGDNKTYLYHRFNHNDTYDVIGVVAKLRGISMTNSLMYISQMLCIEYGVDSQHIQQINKAIDDLKYHLLTVDLKEVYPQTHKLLKDGRTEYGRDIADILEIMRNYVIEVNGEPRMISHLSTRELSTRIYGSYKSYLKIQRVLKLMQLLGLITNMRDNEIPEDILKGITDFKIDKKFSKRINVHEVKNFGMDFLEAIEGECDRLNRNKTTTQTFTRDGILYAFGEKKADEIFVQDTHKKGISEEVKEVEDEIVHYIFENIEKNKYVEMNDVIEHLAEKIGKTKADVRMKQVRQEVAEKYGLEIVRLNKALKKELDVSDKYTQTQAPTIFKLAN